jgi:hypothetical protein
MKPFALVPGFRAEKLWAKTFLTVDASDQPQPLDLVTFASMKQTFSGSKFNYLVNPQSNELVCMLSAWFAASAPHHDIEAFISIGLTPVERDGRFFLMVQPEKDRRVHGLGEVELAGEMFPPDTDGRFRRPTGI